MKKYVIAGLRGSFIGGICLGRWSREEDLVTERNRVKKFEDYFSILNSWLKLKNHGGEVKDYFCKNKFRRIGIYGMGELGKRLYEELEKSDVEIIFAMDKGGYNLPNGLRMVNESEEIPTVDVIVVTPTFDYNNIENSLQQRTHNKIVSISEIFI